MQQLHHKEVILGIFACFDILRQNKNDFKNQFFVEQVNQFLVELVALARRVGRS